MATADILNLKLDDEGDLVLAQTKETVPVFTKTLLTQIEDTLIAAYRLEGGGTDSGPNGLHASLAGAPTWTAGRIGNGMTTTADGQVLTIPDLGISGSDDWSVEISLLVDNSAGDPVGGGRGILMRGTTSGSFGIYHTGSNIRFQTREVGGGIAYSVNHAVQHLIRIHYIWAYDWTNRQMKLYVNGMPHNTVSGIVLPGGTPPSGNWELGSTSRIGSGSSVTPRFRGNSDEVRFYRKVLTDEEALARYNAVVGGVRPAAEDEDQYTETSEERVIAQEFVVISGQEAIRQDIQVRALTSRGERILHPSYGIDFPKIEVPFDENLVRGEIIRTILEDPDVLEVLDVEVSFTGRTRHATFEGNVRLQDDDVLPIEGTT